MTSYTRQHPDNPARIVNVHRRVLRGQLERAGAALDSLGGPGDELWPADRWVPMVLSDGLAIGSSGGHGMVRYHVIAHEPGRSVIFEFEPGFVLIGTHRFAIEAVGGDQVEITHTIDVERPAPVLTALIMPVHDATLEDLLDQAEALLAGRALRRRPSAFRCAASFLEVIFDPAASVPTSRGRRRAGLVGATALAVIGALHSLWAFGSSWPAASRADLATRVIGAPRVPGAVPCLLVSGTLGFAAAAVEARTSSRRPMSTRARGIAAAMTAGTAGVLGIRAIVGAAASALGATPQPYRRYDLTLYSPLCSALAAILTYANSRPTDSRPTTESPNWTEPT